MNTKNQRFLDIYLYISNQITFFSDQVRSYSRALNWNKVDAQSFPCGQNTTTLSGRLKEHRAYFKSDIMTCSEGSSEYSFPETLSFH